MKRAFSLILWAPSRIQDFDSCKHQAYELLATLHAFGPELSPKYLRAMSKKAAREFRLTLDNVEQLLKRKADRLFPDLGYTIGFFTSMNDDESAGISLRIGVSTPDPRFVNSLVVDFPLNFDFGNAALRSRTIDLFRRCCEIFDPFWGCITDNLVQNRLQSFWKDSQPTSIHWVNWYGDDLADRLGRSKAEHAPVLLVEKLEGGYLVVARETPFDVKDARDIQLAAAINAYLGFPGFVSGE